MFAGLLWWAYFDRPQPAIEYRLEQCGDREKGVFARDMYTYAHIPIVAGVIGAAAALEEITLHPKDALPLEFRVMMFGGLALFFGGVLIAVYRAFRVVARERLVGGALSAVLLLAGADLDGVTLLVLLDVLILVVLIVENRRVERIRSADPEPATT